MFEQGAVQVTGLEQGQANLTQLRKSTVYKVGRRSVRAGLRPAVLALRAEAKAIAVSGALAKSVRVTSVKVDRQAQVIRGKVGFKSTAAQRRKGLDAYYAHIVVGGAAPHVIPGPVVIGGSVRSNVQHPGARPNDMVVRAGRASSTKMVSAFGNKWQPELEAEVRAMGK